MHLFDKARREIARITQPPLAFRVGYDAKFEAIDAAINGAITIWHITDWVAESPQPEAAAIVSHARKPGDQREPYVVLKEFVTNNKDVALCHDICNGSKHLELDRPVTAAAHIDPTTAEARDLEAVLSVAAGQPDLWIPKILTPENGARLPAVEVYERAMNYWEQVFRIHQLIR